MLEHLTSDQFKQKVFDFTSGNEWKFQGEKPCVIDFYADWCGPCKMVSPVLEQLSKEYEGKIDVFKIDTDKEQDLAMAFGIRSIPSLLFIPKEGKPQMSVGAMSKSGLENTIKKILLA